MSKEIITEVSGQRLKLTNLDKTIYPSLDITKAQFIKYFMDVSPIIMSYIGHRPLTLIRYPDGVNGKKFYSKSKPKWTPDWLQSYLIKHDSKDIDYLYLHNPASLIWLANLAALEIHPTQFKVENDHKPDHFIFDLDPDEGMDFSHIKQTAFDLKEHIESYGYLPFIKTSGGKGLHLYIPIIPHHPYEIVTKAIKEIAKAFIQTDVKKYTLQVSKGKRVGKILIDIYRNHLGNTCVAPYSTRGKVGAPVSMPITWEYLKEIKSSQHFNILNYKDYLNEYGDAWKDWRKYEVELHTEHVANQEQSQLQVQNQSQVRGQTQTQTQTQNNSAPDPRMSEYVAKRNFEKTAEPGDYRPDHSRKDQFVVQMHDASNLHYDLRLEHEGTLWSWAIPKGLPFQKGVKRLSIQTEDHPVKYLDFEGAIPKGSYGGGTMWVMDQGKVTWQSKKEGKSLKFMLSSMLITGEYKLYKLKGDQWLCELVSSLSDNKRTYKPMLADAAKEIPKGPDYAYEVKWDGIRAFIIVDNGKVKILSRSGRDITEQFEEMQDADRFEIEYGVFDCEIVVLDEQGRPKFHDVISRMHNKKKGLKISSKPATCYLFDVLNVDGIDLTSFAFNKRREILEACFKKGNTYRLSDLFDDGELLFQAIKAREMEGIMAKKKSAKYYDGQRSTNWLKIKCRTDDEAHIIGYTKGKGDRIEVFGALHLAKKEGDEWRYMGKVGTGFDMAKLKELFKIFSKVPISKKLIEDTIEEPERTIWIEPIYSCELNYASLSSNGTYREPVFKRLKK